MSTSLRLGLTVSAALIALCACNAGEIVVFQSDAGRSGMSAASGSPESGASSSGASASGTGAGAEASGGAANAGTSQAGAPLDSTDKPCTDNTDCDQSWFCKKLSCSDTQGGCAPIPLDDDPSLAPVCGCDQVNYWNDTLRRQRGIAAIINQGECGIGASSCRRDQGCAVADANCSHLLPRTASCSSSPGTGACWVTPSECPSSSERKRWLPCPPPGGPGAGPPPPCRSTCEAVQSGFPHVSVGPDLCP